MKLSIGIPTRQRASCLRESLKTAVKIDSDEIEIVVSDNASEDETRDVVESFGDPRIKYFKSDARVSMRQNFETTVNHCQGDYVITMGDDDGIVSSQIPFVFDLIDEYQPDMLFWHVPQFLWSPDAAAPNANTLRIRKDNVFGAPEFLDSDQLRTDLLACRHKKLRPLPALYHGMAARSYLDTLRTSDGVLYNCNVPDFYISYLAILNGGRFLSTNHTFSVSGASANSTGADMSSSTKADKDGTPGEQHRFEVRQDTVPEIFDTTLSVPLAVFGALETARTHPGAAAYTPDYTAWYGLILHSYKNMNAQTCAAIDLELKAYAERTGTQAELANARPKLATGQRSLTRSVQKALGNLGMVRLCEYSDPGKTIATAIEALDTFLGDTQRVVRLGNVSRTQAWRAAKARVQS